MNEFFVSNLFWSDNDSGTRKWKSSQCFVTMRERPLFGMLSIEVKEIGIKTHKHK